MNKTNSKSSFDEATDARLYLQQFGANMHRAKFSDQEKFKEKIKEKHDRQKIKMLLGRVKDMLDNKKSLNYVFTAFFVILAFVIGNQIKFSESLFEYIEEISYQSISVYIGAFLAFIVWTILTYRDKALLEELNGYKRLLFQLDKKAEGLDAHNESLMLANELADNAYIAKLNIIHSIYVTDDEIQLDAALDVLKNQKIWTDAAELSIIAARFYKKQDNYKLASKYFDEGLESQAKKLTWMEEETE